MGFTIFILGLIMVATMIPGLMVGWQRSISIDYDAVAYRTGVILAEDAGWGPDGTPRWETYDAVHLAEVTRIGLAVWSPFGGDSQNVLAPIKLAKFCNSPRYGTSMLLELDYPDDYRSRVIFGDVPYQFNISLRTFDGAWSEHVGSPLPSDYAYGYIRRVVKVREISNTTIDGTPRHLANYRAVDPWDATYNLTLGNFSVRLNSDRLDNKTVPSVYSIDPRTEPLWINITGFESYLNNSATGNPWAIATSGSYLNATLERVEIYQNNQKFLYDYDEPDHEQDYLLLVDGNDVPLNANRTMNSSVCLRINEGWLPMQTDRNFQILFRWNDSYRYNITNPLDVEYLMPNQTPPHTTIYYTNSTDLYYDYNPANVTQPRLRDGVLEVMVW